MFYITALVGDLIKITILILFSLLINKGLALENHLQDEDFLDKYNKALL